MQLLTTSFRAWSAFLSGRHDAKRATNAVSALRRRFLAQLCVLQTKRRLGTTSNSLETVSVVVVVHAKEGTILLATFRYLRAEFKIKHHAWNSDMKPFSFHFL